MPRAQSGRSRQNTPLLPLPHEFFGVGPHSVRARARLRRYSERGLSRPSSDPTEGLLVELCQQGGGYCAALSELDRSVAAGMTVDALADAVLLAEGQEPTLTPRLSAGACATSLSGFRVDPLPAVVGRSAVVSSGRWRRFRLMWVLQRVLHQVLCLRSVAGEGSRHAQQHLDLGHDELLEPRPGHRRPRGSTVGIGDGTRFIGPAFHRSRHGTGWTATCGQLASSTTSLIAAATTSGWSSGVQCFPPSMRRSSAPRSRARRSPNSTF